MSALVVSALVAPGILVALLLTWRRSAHWLELIAGLPASAAAALLCWLPLLAERWDYFRRTPPPPIGWELAPLGVIFAPYLLAVLGGVSYLIALVVVALARAIWAGSASVRHPRGRHDVAVVLSVSVALILVVPALVPLAMPKFSTAAASEPAPTLRVPPGCLFTLPGGAPFRGDPRDVAPRPEDLGPEWNTYTESLEELNNGAYSATYRLGNPAADGVLLSFKVRIFGDNAGAAADFCRHNLPSGALSFDIGDGLYFDPPMPIEHTLETSGRKCPEDNGGVFFNGVSRARNILLELSVRQPSGHAWCETSHAVTAARAFVERVSAH